MSEGKRSEKVADVIRKEISEMILLKTIKDPRIGFLTITRVLVSDDCRMARVYFSVMGDTDERDRSLEGLNSARGYIRKELGRRMSLRYTPDILFQFDPSIEYAIHIDEVIHHLHEERKKNDGD
ncbi:MAG: ribosome-binding factor A [Deltaproteobacteria bacterium RBG_13_52_11b]|nr:MAG: ribosome-binding factor A [Deltaproteobacteria bacterium RBG_13_52_11b]